MKGFSQRSSESAHFILTALVSHDRLNVRYEGEEHRIMESAERFGRPYTPAIARRQGWLTTVHTAIYRLSGGRVGATLLGMPMLLLTTIGRRTGRVRTAPLLYVPVDTMFVLVASNGGARSHPTWWFNLQSHPEALVQIGAHRGRVTSRTATPMERDQLWPLMVQMYPPYVRYQARTDRVIPLVLLDPIDTELYRAVPPRYRQPPRTTL
jgi:deazaflavin-dependent oxidoreductase (nitroreductase family)